MDDALQWTGVPSRVYDTGALRPLCPQDRLLIHCNLDQDKVVTEDVGTLDFSYRGFILG